MPNENRPAGIAVQLTGRPGRSLGGQGWKINFCCQGSCCLQHPSHEHECRVAVVDFVGCDTVGRNHDTQIAHVRVVGREKHTDIGSESTHHERARAQIAQQRVQGRRKEGGMLWLEHEVVVCLGVKTLDERPSLAPEFLTPFDDGR